MLSNTAHYSHDVRSFTSFSIVLQHNRHSQIYSLQGMTLGWWPLLRGKLHGRLPRVMLQKYPSGLHACVYAPFVNVLPIIFAYYSSTLSNAYCSQIMLCTCVYTPVFTLAAKEIDLSGFYQ